jgi:phage-related protein (TIGR01555 family)
MTTKRAKRDRTDTAIDEVIAETVEQAKSPKARRSDADRTDDWASTTSPLGGVRDKHTGLRFARRRRLSRKQLEALYEQNPIVARVVDRLANDAFREGWELSKVETDDGVDVDVTEIKDDLDDLQIDATMARAVKWSRLYGGALMTLPLFDGGTSEQPMSFGPQCFMLNPSVVPAHDARPRDMDAGFNSPTYLKVLNYDVTGLSSTGNVVHHSRVIPFEPISLPPEALIGSPTGWGPSVIDRLFDDLGRDGASASHAVSMMYIASILYVKLHAFREESVSKEGREKLTTLLQTMRERLDSMGILGIDAKDDIGALTLTINGAHELIDRMRARLASAADMPKEILFNESPAGLNAGELSGPQELWFAHVAAFQREILTPAIDRVLEVYFRTKGIRATSWVVTWRPLWTKSDDKSAETYAKNATADAVMIDKGVVSELEVRKHRFVEGKAGPIELEAERTVPPLDLSAPDVESYNAAANAPPSDTGKVADEALTGVQITSLLQIQKDLNAGVGNGGITYAQAVGVVALSFPSMRGREAEVLGPMPPVLDLSSTAKPPPAPAPTPEADELELAPSLNPDHPPEDLATPQEAAAAFHVPTRTITKAIAERRLKFLGLGAHKRVSLAAVGQLARAHELEPEPAEVASGEAPAA